MKSYGLAAAILLPAMVPALSAQAPALNGEPYIHDPSTIAFSDGKYFTFGTGGGGLISEDGWTWHGGAQRPGGGVAPDLIKIGDRYYMSYAKGGGGMSGGHASNVYVMWTKSLDPNSLDFKFNDETIVASSDGTEDCDAIDPLSCSIPPRAGCGSATEPISATFAWLSSTPKRVNASRATRR